MVSKPENPQPRNSQYIQCLQSDVISLLKEISALMARTKNNLRNDDSGKKYRYFCQEVNQAISNVANLELRMAIVAPMKAGKSTIINAIVGQDLLPSRNAAMTTIPTKICFNPKREKPVLVLNQEIISVFEETWDSLQKQMNTWGTEVMSAKIAQYPHLRDLATEIKINHFDIDQEITNKENISLVLTKLNDIVRLGSTLEHTKDPLARLADVPCIETPFWHNETTEESQYLGNLVIVDTPGPNEARDNLVLTAVVEQELKHSSIVLIVLDFTQLNNQAAEAVKNQVQPVIKLIGKENLYVLVNKVDQRRQGDMTPEQVKDFVYADLNLSESSDSDRIFEISARQAFSATKFLLELQHNPDIDIPEMKTRKALAQEVLGIDWDKDLEEVTIEELREKANKLLHQSGFTPFLNQAIQALRESAALKCISSALNRCYGLLRILKNDLNLRIHIISQDVKRLESEITALALDLANLELCGTRLQSVDKIKTSLQTNLDQIIQQLQEDAPVVIENYFEEQDYEEANFVQKVDIKARETLLTNLDEGNVLPKFITDKLKDSLGYKADHIVEFSSQNEANTFVIEVIAWSKIRSENCLQVAYEYTENVIQKSQQELVDFLELETKDILDKARHQLNKDFDIKLSVPPNPQINTQLDFIHSQVNNTTREIRDYKIEKYRPWYFLWLIELERQVPITKTESYYTVSLEEIVKEVNISIETSVNKITEDIYQYLDKEFQESMDSFFAELDTYLSDYRNYLIQLQQDQQLSLVEKNKWIEQLSALVLEADQKLTETDSCIQQTKQHM